MKNNFFLDSVIPGSLTLRDYSKVCLGRNTSFFQLNLSAVNLEVFMRSSTMLWATRVLLVLFCLVDSTVMLAQSTGGRVLGRVADPSGAVLANVSVRITNQATGVARDTKTNGSGDYTFVEVAPGNYTAEFEQKGFKRNVQKDGTVDVNQVVT